MISLLTVCSNISVSEISSISTREEVKAGFHRIALPLPSWFRMRKNIFRLRCRHKRERGRETKIMSPRLWEQTSIFSLHPSLFWQLRNKRNLKILQFSPESLGAMLKFWYIERGLLASPNPTSFPGSLFLPPLGASAERSWLCLVNEGRGALIGILSMLSLRECGVFCH